MNIFALLTSAGINIGICALLLSLYSVLRKQPGNVSVYFGRRLAEQQNRSLDSFSLERFVPSPGWIVKAWKTSDEEILASAGLDAVAFVRMLVFSIRIFSIAAVVCLFGVLPLNYYGQYRHHVKIPSESLDVFTIANVEQGSRWLWVHCLALYIISCSAYVLLYFEYRRIAQMRLIHITQSSPNPSHFTVLVRSIPWPEEGSLSDVVHNFFTKYHASSYLSHQMIYRVGKVQKLMNDAEKVYKKVCLKANMMDQKHCPLKYRSGLCVEAANTSQLSHDEFDLSAKNKDLGLSDSTTKLQECAAAFVFFKTRYAAVIASEVLQSSNPMSWVTDLAPEPHDVHWSNLWIPYRQLWFRRIATRLASIVFMFLFIVPVTFVQGLSQLDQLQQAFPFLKGILKKIVLSRWQEKKHMLQGLVFYYMECVLCQCLIWIYYQPAKYHIESEGNTYTACQSCPKATFFITYVLTSGWASLSSEAIRLFSLIWNFTKKYIFGRKNDPTSVPSFPYHTEVPRVLLFGLLGFTCAILAPLILPFLLVYFLLGYVVYRNQILNVYVSKYETGGRMWPIAHNTTIFSLLLAQIIALGVFGVKKSPVASGFVIPLLIFTLLFSEYCRQRFRPIFEKFSAQDLIEMDKEDETCGRMDEIHQQLQSAYRQFSPDSDSSESAEDDGSIARDVDVKDCSN
ncbi:CSC1-like protein RXW8 isoform X5 [Asparagus officinalis]|uniref:CSC1-like protein RXW8 isoform X5 n=1 Tax=Asparagus officinalis TaxID=4686 RepID=UPI00098E7CE0|nr:CSC1-like protein RXW8 isoform X5 [Asparagus officinalis]